ncbi:hypothetical protein BS78_10G234600 [Paspalum vaginatum]|nr:hypothetical protein BS78_10G234600 [Paspalum vaginatum]
MDYSMCGRELWPGQGRAVALSQLRLCMLPFAARWSACRPSAPATPISAHATKRYRQRATGRALTNRVGDGCHGSVELYTREKPRRANPLPPMIRSATAGRQGNHRPVAAGQASRARKQAERCRGPAPGILGTVSPCRPWPRQRHPRRLRRSPRAGAQGASALCVLRAPRTGPDGAPPPAF